MIFCVYRESWLTAEVALPEESYGCLYLDLVISGRALNFSRPEWLR